AGHTGNVTVMGSLGTRSSVVFDLDGDGDLDIVTNEFNAEPQVLISNLAQRRRVQWIGVALRGTTSNRNGWGAAVQRHADPLHTTALCQVADEHLRLRVEL